MGIGVMVMRSPLVVALITVPIALVASMTVFLVFIASAMSGLGF
jgi:hypothetical protein